METTLSNKQTLPNKQQMTFAELCQVLTDQTVMQLWQAEDDDGWRFNEGEMSEAEAETRAAFWQQVGEILIERGRQMWATGPYIRRERRSRPNGASSIRRRSFYRLVIPRRRCRNRRQSDGHRYGFC
jgi:hypothetical protein